MKWAESIVLGILFCALVAMFAGFAFLGVR